MDALDFAPISFKLQLSRCSLEACQPLYLFLSFKATSGKDCMSLYLNYYHELYYELLTSFMGKGDK
eukprot:scaffold319256_cov13-Tisochrysis_lutea.AAC.1